MCPSVPFEPGIRYEVTCAATDVPSLNHSKIHGINSSVAQRGVARESFFPGRQPCCRKLRMADTQPEKRLSILVKLD
jgi:hypothetical protein